MATYRQTWTYFEDGFGLCRILFVIADTYDNLFETAGTVDCNVFSVGSVKQDLNLSKGTLAADELQVSVDEASIETTDDEDAVQFFREAQDRTTPRYVALFVNTPDLPTAPVVTDALFAGVFSPTMKATDIQHHGAMYSSAINAVREWDASASTFLDNAIEDVSFADLIDGNVPEDVTGIDAGWITANVADRIGYHKSAGGDPWGDRSARFEQLVNLNTALRKLADNLEQTLQDRGLGTFSIAFDVTALDVSFSPARFNALAGLSGQRSRMLPLGAWGSAPPYRIYDNDTVSCSFGDGVSDDNSIWVHWRMFKPVGKTESAMSYRRCKTFTEFLYGLAASLGMFVRFYSAPGNELRIKFISRQSLEQAEVFIRDSESGSIDLSSESQESASKSGQYAVSTLYTPDGIEKEPQSWPRVSTVSTIYGEDMVPTANHQWVSSSEGSKALLSTGVSLKYFKYSEDAGVSNANPGTTCIPHNSFFYMGASKEYDLNPNKPWDHAIGITSAIYVKTLPIGESVSPGSTAVFLPVAAVNAKIDGEEKIFYSLTSYVNHLTGRDGAFYEASYDLVVPYLNCFSLSNTGSSPSWKNIVLGSKFVIEENSIPITFLVVGLERDVSSVSTKIKLHLQSRFAFTTPSGPSAILSPDPDDDESTGESTLPDPTNTGVAGETIATGEAVRLHWDGSDWVLMRMKAWSDYYDTMIGIALNDAVIGDTVRVQTSGIVSIASYSFTPGQAVVVRTSTLPTLNVTQSRLTRKSRTEDMIVDIGTADTPTSFVLDIFKQLIFRT